MYPLAKPVRDGGVSLLVGNGFTELPHIRVMLCRTRLLSLSVGSGNYLFFIFLN